MAIASMDARITLAQYSPLFASGLLSAPFPKQARDSLPLTVNTVSFHAAVRSSFDPDAMFLTLMHHRRHDDEGMSFLSLDLADPRPARSMSLRRNDTVSSRATHSSEPTSPTSALLSLHSALPSPKLRRPSRETLRLPSPKPAPSATLPQPPAPLKRRRASNLTLTLSTCLASSPAASPSLPDFLSPTSPMHRPSHSAPSIPVAALSPSLASSPILSPGHDRSYFMFSPVSPTHPSSFSTRTPEDTPAAVPLRPSPSFRSVASANTRQRNRSAALAMLEGRTRTSRHKPRPRNFMSMSDDEDDGDDERDDSPAASMQTQLLQVLREEEGLVLPSDSPSAISSQTSPLDVSATSEATACSSGSASHARRGTIESFLSPLTNFIDLKDDDHSSRSWRSFVEVA